MAASLTAPIATFMADRTAVPDRRRAAGLPWATLALRIVSGRFVITCFSVTRELKIWDIKALRFGVGALPSAATAIIALLPVVASLLAIPVLGEVPLPAQWAAIVVIGMGVCLAARRPSVRSAFPKRPTRGE